MEAKRKIATQAAIWRLKQNRVSLRIFFILENKMCISHHISQMTGLKNT